MHGHSVSLYSQPNAWPLLLKVAKASSYETTQSSKALKKQNIKTLAVGCKGIEIHVLYIFDTWCSEFLDWFKLYKTPKQWIISQQEREPEGVNPKVSQWLRIYERKGHIAPYYLVSVVKGMDIKHCYFQSSFNELFIIYNIYLQLALTKSWDEL